MSNQPNRLRRSIGVACAMMLLGGALAAPVRANDTKDRDDARVVGTWRVRILFPGFPTEFFTLETFNEGGTMTEVFVDGPRTSVSNGVWKKIHGPGNYAGTIEGFIDTDADGFYDRRFRVRLTIHLLDDDTLTATATSDNLTLDGAVVTTPSLPGITIRATRMRVLRE